MIETSVKELCLVCRGERWLPDPLDPSRSRPCPFCDAWGWVEIAPASLGEPESLSGPGPEGSRIP